MALTQAVPLSSTGPKEPPLALVEEHEVRALDLNGPLDTSFAPFDMDWPRRGIMAHFLDIVRQQPEATAIVEAGRSISYTALSGRIFELARRIEKQVPGPGAIGIVLRPSPLFWTSILACLAARRPYTALDIRHPAERNADLIRSAGLAAVIAPAAFDLARMVIPATMRRIDADTAPLSRSDPFEAPEPFAPDQPAAILFTSGSTGRPKGIANSEGGLLQRVAQYVNAAHLNAHDHFLTLSSPCTIAGTREGLTALLVGATLHMTDIQEGGLGAVARLIEDAQITVLNSVPAVLRALIADRPDFARSARHLRIIRIGGETLFWSDLKLIRRAVPARCHVQAAYSSTEATGTQWFVPPDARPNGSFVPVGYLLPGVAASVVNEANERAAAGEVGELVLRGEHIALGVWENGVLRPGGIQADAADPGMREFRTGDLASMDRNGLLTIVGRADRQVKINGMRVEPAEIEAALRDLPDIADAAVLADRSGKLVGLIAFVVFQPGAAASIQSVRAALRTVLPAPMRPSRIVVTDGIPHLPSGKLDITALAALGREPEAGSVKHMVGTSNDLPGAVRRMWGAILGARSLANGLSFEDAGGDSLKLLQLVLGLERLLDCHLALDLFDPTTRLDDLILIVGRLAQQDGATTPSDLRPLVFLLPGLDGDEPRLAAFRSELQAAVRFSVIDYPDWTETAIGGHGFETLITSALSRIVREQPAGPIRLAGYLYGGDVGFAVASRLIALGREVTFLAILDTDLHQVTAHAGLYGQNRMPRRWRQVFQDMADEGRGTGLGFLLAKCARDIVGLERVARHQRLWRWLLPRRTEFAFDRRMRRISRLRDQWGWHDRTLPALIETPTVLFRSWAHGQDAPPDLNWRIRCPNLAIVAVQGDHRTMFDAPNRATLGRCFAEALAQSEIMSEQSVSHDEGTSDKDSQPVDAGSLTL